MTFVLFTLVFLLGVFVGITAYWAYFRESDGDLIVTENQDGSKTYILELEIEPYYIDQKRRVIFKVIHDDLDLHQSQ